jgi:FMN reductase
MHTIVAISGGVGIPSSSTKLADRILGAVRDQLQLTGVPAQVEVIELRPLAHDLVDMTLTGIASEALEEVFEKVQRAHGVVVVTPVYNAAPLGLLSLFWQVFPDAGLRGIPVMLAATGGTARHSLALDTQLRPLITYLKGLALPTTVFAATDDWGSPEAVSGLGSRIGAAAEELAQLVAAQPAETRDVFDDLDPEGVTPFDQLLGG